MKGFRINHLWREYNLTDRIFIFTLRDFAYIARDPTTKKHRCHMFRCHGQVSGRSVTNALQAICTRVLDEKRKAKERNENPAHRKSSDLLRPPSKGNCNIDCLA